MVIVQRPDAPVLLKDVARVEDGEEDVRALARFSGEPTRRHRRAQADRREHGRDLRRGVPPARRSSKPLLPEGITIGDGHGFIDFSQSIREAVAETEFALVFGALLAVLTVFVFLRRDAADPDRRGRDPGLADRDLRAGLDRRLHAQHDDPARHGARDRRRDRRRDHRAREHRAAPRDGQERRATPPRDGTREITFAATAATFSVAAVFLPVIFVQGIVGNIPRRVRPHRRGLGADLALRRADAHADARGAHAARPKERAHGSIYH